MSGIDALSSGIAGGAEVWGRGSGIGAAAQTDIWGKLNDYEGFPESIAPVECAVVSDSANDASAGSGCQEVEVYVLRSITSKRYEKVVVETDGTSLVNTNIGNIYRAILCRGTRFGSTGSNVGTIRVRPVAADNADYCYMLPTVGRSQECVYTVPQGNTIDLRRVRIATGLASGASTALIISIFKREFQSGGFRAIRTFDITSQTGLNIDLPIPPRLEPLTDVKVRTQDVSDGGTDIDCTLDFGP